MAGLDLRAEAFDGPSALQLIELVQAEYVHRYGGPDDTALDPADFALPRGMFFVGYLDHRPVACGGWRSLAEWEATAEIKRMYVEPTYRGRGLARAVLARLESSARDAGYSRLWLETGLRQPEAIELYRSAGYVPIEGYGHYRGAPLARAMGKQL